MMHVTEYGSPEGMPVVFLHGAMVGGWMWTEQAIHLPMCHCLLPDFPGVGGSGAERWVSLADTADQVAAMIRARCADGSAHVVGLSLGAVVALYVALRHPDVVRSLLVSGAPFGVIPTPLRWLSTGMLWLYGRSWGARVLATMMGMPDAESREAFVHTAVQTHPDTLHTVMAEIHQTPLPSGLEQIATPTLAVVGTKDTKPALQAVHYFAETIPQVVACTVPGVGHMWNAEQPELFTEMVAAWVGGYGVIDALERVTVPMVGNR